MTNPPARLAFHPQTLFDFKGVEERLGATAYRRLMGVIRGAAERGDHLGGRVVDTPQLAGLRQFFVHTEQSRTQGLPDIAVISAVHSVPDRAAVLNIVAARPVADLGEIEQLHHDVIGRIYPENQAWVPAFTPGVGREVWHTGGAWDVIHTLCADESRVFAGDTLEARQGADLRGTLRVHYLKSDRSLAEDPSRIAIIYSLHDPPGEATFRTIEIHKVGPIGDDATYLEAAARRNTLTAHQRKAGRAHPQAPSRAQAARLKSPQGSATRPAAELGPSSTRSPQMNLPRQGQDRGPAHGR